MYLINPTMWDTHARALRRNLPHNSFPEPAAVFRAAVEVSLSIESQVAARLVTIRAAEVMQSDEIPASAGRRQFEDHAGFTGAAAGSTAINVSCAVEQGHGNASGRAARLRHEQVDHAVVIATAAIRL